MKYQHLLITGGAGFVGSNLALALKRKYPGTTVYALDNLKRRGAELNLPRLQAAGVRFIHGDIRNKEDFEELQQVDLIFECSAEPSVLAGITSSPSYLINTNLLGAVNCLEFARQQQADFILLSTSRVYPIELINNLNYLEDDRRFSLAPGQTVAGASPEGIAEEFPLTGARSLYGTTKLCAELLLQEYSYHYGLKGIINRCGVITGPWQMGKVDQGVFVLWVARHIFGGRLAYLGYGGSGKQVRDFLHIDDLCDLLDLQLKAMDKFAGGIFNVGGGRENSLSLRELTELCQQVTGKKIAIDAVQENRPADLKLFITDCRKIKQLTGWQPRRQAEQTVADIAAWILQHHEPLKAILS